MKLSLILAAIAVSAQAGEEFKPKKTPKTMRGAFTQRWTDDAGAKVGDDAIDATALTDAGKREVCIKEAQKFDDYCHQIKIEEGGKKAPKYADYTDENDSCDVWAADDGTVTVEQTHCLAQDCMFDYCIYKRDEQFAACESFVDEWESEIATQGVDCEEFG